MRLTGLTSIFALCAALPALAEPTFNRIASFATPDNMSAGEDRARATSAEIISVNDAGDMLVYSDSPLGVLGFVDITDPATPKPLGNVKMDGEPTTAVIIGKRAFVGVNTGESKANPSGALRVIDLATEQVVESCDLGGQPDSVAKARDGSFLAIAIENERDEEVNDGALPQMPAGYVVKLPVKGDTADCAALQKIDLTGLAEIAPEDPEPEFVSINDAGEIVVTLQENNHIVIIGADGKVASHFSAGSVNLEGIDTKSNGEMSFTDTQENRLREPDGVKWLGNDRVVTANEGDWKGGSRGWTIFNRDGSVVYEDGAKLERAVAAIGHYPEKRSKAKGIEPESIEIATFDGVPTIFVVSERASVIGVYDATDPTNPVLKQILPSGISPEGLVAIPARNLIASANEVDLGEDGGARAHVMLYERSEAPAAYPMLTSAGTAELIGWGALGALAAGDAPGHLFAASDSVYSAAPTIFTIDATQKPARITEALTVTRNGHPAQKLDIEGIATDGEGGFWLASEGDSAKLVPHAVYHVNKKGEIKEEIALPAELLKGEKRFGFEGITVIDGRLWMAVQREWGDDPKGQVKLLSYDPEAKEWGAVRYPLDTPAEGAWVGLSEITRHGDWVYIIERDNQIGEAAALKAITRVAVADLKPAELDGDLPLVKKETVRDLIPDLKVLNGYVVDKVEGFAIDAAGNGWVVTDNDGTDDSSGETLFWSIGEVK
ncbi:MAG: esterase-like activity of phytase family protein [Paracoccaceae bacterium]